MPVQRNTIAQGLYELAYSPRRHELYVASSGGRGADADPGRLVVVDPDTLEEIRSVALPGVGFGLALDDAAGRVYVGDGMNGAVYVVDLTAESSPVTTLHLGGEKVVRNGIEQYELQIRKLAVDPQRHRLYVPALAFEDSVLIVVDTRDGSVEKRLPGFGFVTAGIVVDPERPRLWISNTRGQVFTVDADTLTVTEVVEAAGDQLLNIAYDASGDRLFATDQGHPLFLQFWQQWLPDYEPRGEGNQVVEISAADGSPLRTIATGAGPLDLLFDGERNRLYVSIREAGEVVVIDPSSGEIARRIEIPAHPNSLAVDPATGTVFVTVKNGADAQPGSPDALARIDPA